jgi:hypothetical protein
LSVAENQQSSFYCSLYTLLSVNTCSHFLSKISLSQNFSCTVIDDKQQLYDDPEVVCYEGVHYLMATGAGLSGLFLWGKIIYF